MAKQHSPEMFLRQVRRPLLPRYYKHRQLPIEAGYDAGKAADIDRLH